jgi:hypothetical protein
LGNGWLIGRKSDWRFAELGILEIWHTVRTQNSKKETFFNFRIGDGTSRENSIARLRVLSRFGMFGFEGVITWIQPVS